MHIHRGSGKFSHWENHIYVHVVIEITLTSTGVQQINIMVNGKRTPVNILSAESNRINGLINKEDSEVRPEQSTCISGISMARIVKELGSHLSGVTIDHLGIESDLYCQTWLCQKHVD